MQPRGDSVQGRRSDIIRGSGFGWQTFAASPGVRANVPGRDRCRSASSTRIAEFRKPGATFELEHQTIDGDVGYILWRAETADNVHELGTDTFVVKGGKIVAQSFAGKLPPKR